MVTKIKRLYRSLILAGTGLLSLIFMAFNFMGLLATGDIRKLLVESEIYSDLRVSAYEFFKINKPFKIMGEKVSLDMIKEAGNGAPLAVALLKLLVFCLTIVMITSIVLLIAGLISGVKDIWKKNLAIRVNSLLFDKISRIVMIVHGITVALATFVSIILSIFSLALILDAMNASFKHGTALFAPYTGAVLLLALAIFSTVTIIKFDKNIFRVPTITKSTYTCSACGANHKTPSQFCPTCGGAVGVAQTQEPNPYYIDDTDVEDFDYSLIPLYAKKIWAKIDQFLKEKNITKEKLIKGGAILGGAVIVLVLLLSIVCRPAPKYVEPDQYLQHIYNSEDDETVFAISGKKASFKVEGQIYDIQESIDGSITAFLDEETTLYIIKKNKLVKVAEEVYDYKLSVEGEGIAYVNEDDELLLYSVKKGSSKKITDELYAEYAISPDGKTVAYTKGDDDGDSKLYVSVNGKEGKKIGNNMSPIALSNKGKLIYYVNEEKYTLYVVKGKKDPQKLASGENIEGIAFNADHTQAIFALSSGTYITSNGKEKVKITSGSIKDFGNYSDWGNVIDTGYDAQTLPIKTFAKQYFLSNGSLYYLNARFKAVELKRAEDVRSYEMTLTGEVIYYRDSSGILYRGTGKKANFKFKEVADEVSSFTISSNGKFCYFKTYDDSLMCARKTGKAKLIADDVTTYSMSHDDYLFFRVDGDLYVSHNRSKKTKVADDVSSVSVYVDATYYYVKDDGETECYGAHKKAKFKELVKY